MSKKQIEKGLQIAYAMTKDIAGNTLSGNDVRAMGYIRALYGTLEALQELTQSKGDVRAELKFDERIKAIAARMDEDHKKAPFSGDKSGESFKRFEEAGFSSSDFLDSIERVEH